MSEDTAVLDGYTRKVFASAGAIELCLLVEPDTDLDSRFKAWDRDEQEFIRVNGWLFIIEDT